MPLASRPFDRSWSTLGGRLKAIEGCIFSTGNHISIMKQLLFKSGLLTLALATYMASPFLTAWSIREAVRNGDAVYLERVIDWPSVRETLKPSLGQLTGYADAGPQTETNPGLWQRFKAYIGQSALERTVDSYMTPEGLPQLFAWRKTYRDNISGEPDEAQIYTVRERIARAWNRVKRAEFKSLTEFEMDMADKHDPNRIYLGKLVFTGLGWQLKELRIKFLTTAENAIAKFAETGSKALRGGFVSSAEAAELPDDLASTRPGPGTAAMAPSNPGLFARIKAAAQRKWHGQG